MRLLFVQNYWSNWPPYDDIPHLFHLFCHRLIFSSRHDSTVGAGDVIVARVVDGLVVVGELLRAVEAAAVQLKSKTGIPINCSSNKIQTITIDRD